MNGLRGLLQLPSFVLLLGLCMLVVAWPWFETTRSGYITLVGSVTLVGAHLTVVVLAIRAVVATPSDQRIAALLAVPVVVFQSVWLFADSATAGLATLAALALFYGYTIVAMLRYVLGDDRVNADELFAAAAMYVMTAILWACLYMIAELLRPGAFFINPVNDLDGQTTFVDLLYFSFTTLTSVGFGEITPVSSHARSLVMLEQIVGVMYVALLIARLTGMYPVHTRRPPAKEDDEFPPARG